MCLQPTLRLIEELALDQSTLAWADDISFATELDELDDKMLKINQTE